MAVNSCAGGCERMISISKIPGGNPTALADPKHWAVNYAQCTSCGRTWCDRCHSSLGLTSCPQDGSLLQEVSVAGASGSATGSVPAPQRVAPPAAEAPQRSKWWKPGRG